MRARYHTSARCLARWTEACRFRDTRRHASTGSRVASLGSWPLGLAARRVRGRDARRPRPRTDRCPRTTATPPSCSTTRIEPTAVGYPLDPAAQPAGRHTRPRAHADGRRGRARAGDDRDLEGRGPRALLADRPPHVERLAGSGARSRRLHALGRARTTRRPASSRRFEARLIGKTLRRLRPRVPPRRGAPGEAGDLRFHVAADSPDEARRPSRPAAHACASRCADACARCADRRC